MTRYEKRVRDYLKETPDGSATVADIISYCCSIPQLENLERRGQVVITGPLMGDRVMVPPLGLEPRCR